MSGPSAASRAKRPRAVTAARREEILRAAMEVFGAKGYRQGSLTEVADKVGITHAGVLHHFGSKNQLVTEVIKFRDEVDLESLEGRHLPEGLDLFRHLVLTAARNAERRGIVQAYTVLVGESVTADHPAGEWATTRFSVLRGDIAGALRQVLDEHRAALPEGDAGAPLSDEALSQFASAIIAVMDGLQSQWLLDSDAVDLREATSLAIESLLAAALAGESRPRPLD